MERQDNLNNPNSPSIDQRIKEEYYSDEKYYTPTKKSEKSAEQKSKEKDYRRKYKKIYSATEGDEISTAYASPKSSKFNYEFQTPSTWVSASTLQHSILNYTFSRDTRFKQKAQIYCPMSDNLNMPSTRNTRSAGFGKGEKNPFPGHTMRNARDFPSPDKYYPDLTKIACHSKAKKEKDLGKTFGIAREYYDNNYMEKNPNQTRKQASQIPGPGSYRIATEPGSGKLKYSLYGRPKTGCMTERVMTPGSGTYNIRETLTTRSRFSGITQGKGERTDFSRGLSPSYFPGPGNYNLGSFTDKFKGKLRSCTKPKCTF